MCAQVDTAQSQGAHPCAPTTFRLTPICIWPILALAMKLPNAQWAIVDMNKLANYCLSTEHPSGKHKARVFAARLGLAASDAETLRTTILNAIQINDAFATERDVYGQRYVVDFVMKGPAGRAWVRSAWIILIDEEFPRLTSCYVL